MCGTCAMQGLVKQQKYKDADVTDVDSKTQTVSTWPDFLVLNRSCHGTHFHKLLCSVCDWQSSTTILQPIWRALHISAFNRSITQFVTSNRHCYRLWYFRAHGRACMISILPQALALKLCSCSPDAEHRLQYALYHRC